MLSNFSSTVFDTLGFPLEWKCHICGKIRPDKKISVANHDLSYESKMPKGTIICNVRYCNDNADCEQKAKDESYPHHGQASEYKKGQ